MSGDNRQIRNLFGGNVFREDTKPWLLEPLIEISRYAQVLVV